MGPKLCLGYDSGGIVATVANIVSTGKSASHQESDELTRPCESASQWAFELSRWRDGRCGMDFPQVLLAV
jgi:hypothetical protein